MQQQCSVMVKSGFLPEAIKTPEQALAIAMKGRELGIPMMHAFSHIVIIKGKPTMSAELMLAQIFRLIPGAVVNFLELTNERCIMEAKRPGGKPSIFKFDTDDAQKAELTSKENWRKYPRAMRRSRCVSEMARSLFPDALMGVSHTPEELDPNITINEDGEILDLPISNGYSPAPKHEPKAAAPTPEPQHLSGEALGQLKSPALIGKIQRGQSLKDTPRADIEEVVSKVPSMGGVSAQISTFVSYAKDFLSWQDENTPSEPVIQEEQKGLIERLKVSVSK
jgi:hypothetical protein